MALRLVALCVDANDPLGLARFWAEALGWEVGEDTPNEVSLVPTDGTRFEIVFLRVPEPKVGAARIDIGQGDVDWVVMADPDGNELCVLRSA